MSTDKSEREAFEDWYADQGRGMGDDSFPLNRKPYGEEYERWDVQEQWAAWQARAAQPSQPATAVPVADDTKLTLLMAPYHLNLVVGHDRAQLLAFGRDVWAAAKRGDSPTVRTRSLAEASAAFDAGIEGKEVQHGTGPRSDGSSVSSAVSPEGRDSVTNAQAHPSAPAESGWQWVPVQPTPAMLHAMWQDREDFRGQSENKTARHHYALLLKAAPSAAQPGGEGGAT